MKSEIHNLKSKIGFTLVELLVVVAIIVVLLALLVPAMEKAIGYAERVQCSAIQHRLGLGNILYSQDFKQYFVPVKEAGALNFALGNTIVGPRIWFQYEEFRRYAGVSRDTDQINIWPKEFACPTAPRSKALAGTSWLTMAFNWSGMAPGFDQHLGARRTKIEYPSDKVQMVDSNDWHTPANEVTYYRAKYNDPVGGWDKWGEVDTSQNNAMVNYRHQEGAVMHHFDGSTRFYPKEEAWKSGADIDAERVINSRMWKVYE